MRASSRALLALFVATGVAAVPTRARAAPTQVQAPEGDEARTGDEPDAGEGVTEQVPPEQVPPEQAQPEQAQPEQAQPEETRAAPSQLEPSQLEPAPTQAEPEPDEDWDDEDDARFDDYNPVLDSPEAAVARRWLGAGIAATVAGGVLVGGAIAMASTSPCDAYAGNNCFADARNRAALTMGAPGVAMLIGGVAMTIVGGVQRRRLWMSLEMDRERAGLVVFGRF
ncbi:hypothetical protein G6O69_30695 [Pseudenhygromyxa sp. WMMC2535]|uniref:hypothetical protein n=1 Tax=Pseudenhygromyxa sp. WMMC2535 TaxID=2712867 RepID=UPI0015534187|nr:hypothetical protein [Pseudenhygromyxa sp. WMMC2535]NVB42232.1 hypothetical protein [Pseudenhygromyxa sp. WMMC2535]